jgi:antitoxin CptB
MININLLKKKILYRSEYRGTKEMDLLLSNFVKKYINDFSIVELKQLDDLLSFDDDILFKWYLNKKGENKVPNNKVSNLLKNFKI